MPADMSMWSASIDGARRLYELTMPGSHDAGIYTADSTTTGVGSLSTAVCQSGSIYEQCMMGSRFFDIRLKGAGGDVRAYHQFAGQGALGGSRDTILDDVDKFLKARGSEFVILRISKTKEKDVEIFDALRKSSIKDRLYRGAGNIAQAPINDLRGKVICVFDTAKYQSVSPHLGQHPFSKYTGGGVTMGLQTCGKYADDSSIRNVFASQIKHAGEHSSHARDHLFVLYWTQTGGNIFAHTTKPVNAGKAEHSGGTHHNMNYLATLLTPPGQGKSLKVALVNGKWVRQEVIQTVVPTTWSDRRKHMPNVIMYDFVNSATSQKIVELNDPNMMGVLIEQFA